MGINPAQNCYDDDDDDYDDDEKLPGGLVLTTIKALAPLVLPGNQTEKTFDSLDVTNCVNMITA